MLNILPIKDVMVSTIVNMSILLFFTCKFPIYFLLHTTYTYQCKNVIYKLPVIMIEKRLPLECSRLCNQT